MLFKFLDPIYPKMQIARFFFMVINNCAKLKINVTIQPFFTFLNLFQVCGLNPSFP